MSTQWVASELSDLDGELSQSRVTGLEAYLEDLTDDLEAVTASLALKAPLADPTFTGTVTAPTIRGGTTSAGDLQFSSTGHATKGKFKFGTTGYYNEATNKFSYGGTSGRVVYLTTNGELADSAALTFDGVTLRATNGGIFQNGFVSGNSATLPGSAYTRLASGSSGIKAVVIHGTSTQTANLVEIMDSTVTTVYATISENGYCTTRKTSAPADSELSNSEAAYWFDHTPGAAKFCVKAKDSAGTVVTGSISLT